MHLLAVISARELRTSGVERLADATLMNTSPHLMRGEADRRYFNLEPKVKLFRYGCDCYAFAMVAAGQVELVVDASYQIYDIAALIPIVEAAGGKVTDWQGGSCNEGGQVLCAANEKIHAEAMAVLNE